MKFRSTLLTTALKDPILARAVLRGYQRPDTEAMLLGRAAHKLILEEHDFSTEYGIYDGRKGCKEYQIVIDEKKQPIKMEMFKKINDMKNVLLSRTDDITLKLLNGQREKYIEFNKDNDTHTGRIDSFMDGCLIDYKTRSIPTISRSLWREEVTMQKLHVQLAYYNFLLKNIGIETKRHFHLVQSTMAPYLVDVFEISIDAIEYGKEDCKTAIMILKDIESEIAQPFLKVNIDESLMVATY